MRYEIIIENVDQESKVEIEHVINRYLMNVNGLIDTGFGGGACDSFGPTLKRSVYRITHNKKRKGLLDIDKTSYN